MRSCSTAASQPTRRALPPRLPWARGARTALALALACLALAACGPRADAQAPVAVVQRFVAALEARDLEQIMAQLPPGELRRQIAPEVRMYLSVVERLSFSEPTYEVLANDGERATVRMTATLAYAVRGGHTGENAVEAEFELIRESNEWYLETITWPPLGQEEP